jgi:hypothetical protein
VGYSKPEIASCGSMARIGSATVNPLFLLKVKLLSFFDTLSYRYTRLEMDRRRFETGIMIISKGFPYPVMNPHTYPC